MENVRFVKHAIGVLAVSVGLLGCGGSETGRSTTTIGAGLHPTLSSSDLDSKLANTPFVSLVGMDPITGSVETDGQEQRIAECMNARGFKYQPYESGVSEKTLNDSRLARIGVPSRTVGYGITAALFHLDRPKVAEDPNNAYMNNLSADGRAAFMDALANRAGTGCADVVQRTAWQQDRGEVSGLKLLATVRSDVEAEIKSSKPYISASAQWSRCMGQKGYGFATRLDAIGSIRTEFASKYDAIVGELNSGSSPEAVPALVAIRDREVQTARADSDCDRGTQMTEVYVEQLIDAESRYLERYPALTAK